MKRIIDIKPLKQQTKLSEQTLRDVEAMIMLRFSGSDWSARFKQFRDDNEKRQG